MRVYIYIFLETPIYSIYKQSIHIVPMPAITQDTNEKENKNGYNVKSNKKGNMTFRINIPE